VNDTTRPAINAYVPPRRLTAAQFRIVAVIYRDDLLDYRAIAKATGIGRRTVKHYVEQIALLLPGDGNPLLRVALYAERLIESWPIDRMAS
jgi:DNA-binding CsgD family transcriptional regulator